MPHQYGRQLEPLVKTVNVKTEVAAAGLKHLSRQQVAVEEVFTWLRLRNFQTFCWNVFLWAFSEYFTPGPYGLPCWFSLQEVQDVLVPGGSAALVPRSVPALFSGSKSRSTHRRSEQQNVSLMIHHIGSTWSRPQEVQLRWFLPCFPVSVVCWLVRRAGRCLVQPTWETFSASHGNVELHINITAPPGQRANWHISNTPC